MRVGQLGNQKKVNNEGFPLPLFSFFLGGESPWMEAKNEVSSQGFTPRSGHLRLLPRTQPILTWDKCAPSCLQQVKVGLRFGSGDGGGRGPEHEERPARRVRAVDLRDSVEPGDPEEELLLPPQSVNAAQTGGRRRGAPRRGSRGL